MELHVGQCSGLPDNCVLSVRAGGARRQVKMPARQSLKFPSLPLNCKNVRIDVYESAASAEVDLERDPSESHVVQWRMQDGHSASVTLDLKEQPALCGKRTAELKQVDRGWRQDDGSVSVEDRGSDSAALRAKQDEAAVHAAMVARNYATQHSLSECMQDALQVLLNEMPENPYVFLCEFLSGVAREHGEQGAPACRPVPQAGGAASRQPASSYSAAAYQSVAPTHQHDFMASAPSVPQRSAHPSAPCSGDHQEQYKASAPSVPQRSAHPSAPYSMDHQQQYKAAAPSEQKTVHRGGPPHQARTKPRPGALEVLSPNGEGYRTSEFHVGGHREVGAGLLDLERLELEAEHMSLRAERTRLVRELAELEVEPTVARYPEWREVAQ